MRHVPTCKLIRKDLLLVPSEYRYFTSGDKPSPLGIRIDQSHKRMIRELVAKVIGRRLFDKFRASASSCYFGERQYLEFVGDLQVRGTFSQWAMDQ